VGARLSLDRRLGAVAALAALCVAACAGPAPPIRPNLVLVVVDTLRADHLPLYGYHRPTSPVLSRFAADGVLFADAASPAGCTSPAVNSLLTGREADAFLARRREIGLGIPPDMPSLAPLLLAAGWDTAAVSSSVVVRQTPSKVNPTGGYGAGFRRFDESCELQSGECVNQRALALLDELEEPFLLYLHYLEPHVPYRPPESSPRRFAAAAARRPRWVERGETWPLTTWLYDGARRPKGDTAEARRHLVDLYDDEIAAFDDRLGELLERLDGSGQLDRTVVVVTADHGEELFDHDHLGHCRDLAWNTVLRVPLVMRLPGGPTGVVRKAPVSTVDLLPTLLDYLGLPLPGGFAGRSLRPVVESDRVARRHRLGAQGTVRTLDDGRFKLQHDLESGESRLYDLVADPGERTDVAGEHAELVTRWQAHLLRWVEREGGAASDLVRDAAEAEAQLRAVGYL
jgi:arylsulfatase A-like enzyme